MRRKNLFIPKHQRPHHWGLEMDTQFHLALYNGYNNLSVLGLKLYHISKKAPWCLSMNHESSLLNSKLLCKMHSVLRRSYIMYYFKTRIHSVRLGHYSDVIMSAMASQINSLTIVYSTVYSGTDQRKLRSSAPLGFVRGIHRWPMNSPHKRPVTRKMFPFDDVIMDDAHGYN